MTVNSDGCGERALWTAVISQILLDATAPPRPLSNASKTNEEGRAQEEARRWLSYRTRAKDELLELAGIDPAAFWQQVRAGLPHFREYRRRGADKQGSIKRKPFDPARKAA